jgi:ABC-type nitrate/sulfonate/bicarbonate transport system ATPase subunit
MARATSLRIWSQTAKTVVFVTHSLTGRVPGRPVLVMSARPAHYDRIDIALPRPRTYEMATDVRPPARPHLAADPQGRGEPHATTHQPSAA